MHCGPGPTGWALKSALAALPRLEIAPLFPAHGALLSLISGPNATTDNFETASNMPKHDCEEEFMQSRDYLLRLAYRILGSMSEAEDAVQEMYLKWRVADREMIRSSPSWLTTVCTRHCVDQLRASRNTRVDYIGTWLPEPILLSSDDSPEDALELASSLSTAFLLVLERLAPKERAAYLLREIFSLAYTEVAAALDVEEAACRKLVSRARANIGSARSQYTPPRERQEEFLSAFKTAITSGHTGPLAALLVADVTLSADGGGKVATIALPVFGKEAVLSFLGKSLHQHWRDYDWQVANLNGGPGVILVDAGKVAASVTFAYDRSGCATDIFVVRNPEKLEHLSVHG